MDLRIESKGSFKKVESYLLNAPKADIRPILESCGREGVQALSSGTPVRSGITAGSWYYKVNKTNYGWEVAWYNSNIEDGFPVAIMIQYGHGTGTGGYVQGQDYINPELKPIFDKISDKIWKAVTTA